MLPTDRTNLPGTPPETAAKAATRRIEVAKKLTMTQHWMLDHPDDEPPPAGRLAATKWREKRFGWKVDRVRERDEQDRRPYEKALQESRAAKAEASYPRID